jgi:hypothetical protein
MPGFRLRSYLGAPPTEEGGRDDELHAIAGKSNAVLAGMAPRAQWLHSYVTTDKVYCVYVADDEAAVLEHAQCGGFPANVISQVSSVIDPVTAE